MISRFAHMLVPVDFSAQTQAILDVAWEMSVQSRARVTLLHVIEEIEHVADEEVEEFYGQLEARSRVELEAMVRRFAEAGLDVDWKIRYGKRLGEIVQDCVERQVDLVVMRSHPFDPQRPAEGWTSLSHQVSILCPCPVLLIK
jgi:nucleotide-binding universal stress UspA family protein